MPSATPWYIRGILYVALPAACVAALYLSIPGEVALARTAGWSEHYAPAMPVCLSVYALSAGAIATYRRKMELPGQLTALVGSLMALLLAMSAQSISHLIEQDYMNSSALLVVAVSCVPPLTIAHLVHMAETPSQVKTTSQQMTELTGMIDYLSVELTHVLSSHTDEALTYSRNLATAYDKLTAGVQELIEGAESDAERIDAALSPRRGGGPKKAVPEEKIKEAARELKAKGKRVSGPNLAALLGVGESTAARYISQGLATV